MQESVVEHFLSQIPDVGQIRRSGDWHLTIPCIMGHRHAKGRDSRASMTVSFDVEEPFVECFACGYKARLETALHTLAGMGRLSAATALAFTDAKQKQLILPSRVKPEPVLQDYTLPLKDLLELPYSKNALAFLASRNIKVPVAKAMKIAYVPEGHTDDWMPERADGTIRGCPKEGLLLPIITKVDDKNICVGAQVRLLEGHFRYFALYKFAASNRLFGEQVLPQAAGKHLFLVEGPFDALHIMSEGSLAVGLLGTKLSAQKALLLKQANAQKVHILLDNDRAGRQGAEKAASILREHGVPFLLHQAFKDPKQYSAHELKQLTQKTI